MSGDGRKTHLGQPTSVTSTNDKTGAEITGSLNYVFDLLFGLHEQPLYHQESLSVALESCLATRYCVENSSANSFRV